MRPSPKRKTYDPADYTQQFRDVLEKFHVVMNNHHGRRQDPITCREWTVESTYLFTAAGDGPSTKEEVEEEVILNLSHNANGQFTKHNLDGAGDHPTKYLALKEEIHRLANMYSSKATKHITYSRPQNVDIFHEIRKALGRLDCTDVSQRDFRHAMKFTGKFGNLTFMFNVYHTAKDGRLQTKKGKRTIVWDRPKETAVPVLLKRELDNVVVWVKKAEAGGLTPAEIAVGLNGGHDLVVGMGGLSL